MDQAVCIPQSGQLNGEYDESVGIWGICIIGYQDKGKKNFINVPLGKRFIDIVKFLMEKAALFSELEQRVGRVAEVSANEGCNFGGSPKADL